MAERSPSPQRFLATELGRLAPVIGMLFALSCTINVLALTGSFYMLQVYDRVLSSQSVPTLVVLSLLAGGLFVFQGTLEVIRGQILVRVGSLFNQRLSGRAHEAAMRMPLVGVGQREALQPIRDLDTIRGFLSGQGPMAMLDLPWLPIFLAFVFALHPLLGWVTLAGALVLVALTLATERLVHARSASHGASGKARMETAEASARNAEVIRAMGLGSRLAARFRKTSDLHIADNERLSDIVGGFSAVSRTFRLALQSGLLGLGAYLTIKGQMSAGAIIACTIAASRALAPIEIAIANWRGMVAAREARARLAAVLSRLPQPEPVLELPAPYRSLIVDKLSVVAPGKPRLLLANASFALEAGQVAAIIGPSGAGKSSLVRSITGVWPAARGAVLFDDASLDRWNPEALGQHIGYLPQGLELFDGTVAENIARLDPDATAESVIDAAQSASVHKLILSLPNGYETRIGESGAELSAGQRQRIALARALYGRPFLVVLDEPNANLDAEGEEAVIGALMEIKQRRGIAIVVAHRPSVLAAADLVGVIGNGQLVAFGPRDEVLKKALRQVPATAVAAPAVRMPAG